MCCLHRLLEGVNPVHLVVSSQASHRPSLPPSQPTTPRHRPIRRPEVQQLISTTIASYYTKSVVDAAIFITKSVNDLTNYYLKSETFTKAEVNQLIAAVSSSPIRVWPSCRRPVPTEDLSVPRRIHRMSRSLSPRY